MMPFDKLRVTAWRGYTLRSFKCMYTSHLSKEDLLKDKFVVMLS